MNQAAEMTETELTETELAVTDEPNASSGDEQQAAGSGKHRAGKAAKPAKQRVPRAAAKTAKAPASARRRGRRLRAVALPLAVLVTAGAAVSAFILNGRTSDTQHLQAIHTDGQSAMTTAVSDAKDILSYDYRQIETNIDTAKGEITGQLLSDYSSTAAKLLKQAASIKAIVTATVSASSVVHADTGRVTVLLYVDQESVKQLKGQKSPSTRIDPLRVQMTMSKVKGRWLASDLQPV